MSQPFLGQIYLVGFNFAPRGFALCQGQLISIAQNTALFALLGTTYGGNGQTTFALPDLRGRIPMGFGQGPGLANYTMGESSGAETVTLLVSQIPAHTHQVNCSSDDATQGTPLGNYPANASAYTKTPDTTMNPGMLSAVGGSQPHNNLQPYLVMNYVIALQGIFPSRN